MKKPNSPSPLFAIFRHYSPFFAIGPPPIYILKSSAELRQKQSLLEALQQAVKLQKDAILLQQQQQQQQQQQAKTEPPQNTLKNFMSCTSSSAPVKRISLTPVPSNSSVNTTNTVVTGNSTPANLAGQTQPKGLFLSSP